MAVVKLFGHCKNGTGKNSTPVEHIKYDEHTLAQPLVIHTISEHIIDGC